MVIAHASAVGRAHEDEELDALVARALAALELRCAAIADEHGTVVSQRGETRLTIASSEHRTRVVASCELRLAPAPVLDGED